MDDQSLFNQQNPGTGTPQTPTVNTDFSDLLSLVKNERGEPKYKDVPAALEGLRNAQEFIPQIKSELDQLKAERDQLKQELASKTSVEQVLERLSASQNQGQPAVGLDQEAVAALVNQTVQNTLGQREKEAVQKNNITTVVHKIKERYGDKADEVFYGKAQQLGLSREDMNRLAAQNPQVVLQLFETPNQSSPNVTVGKETPALLDTKVEPISFRNDKGILAGATSEEFRNEAIRSKEFTDKLNAQGVSVHDLSDPKQYFKYFGKI